MKYRITSKILQLLLIYYFVMSFVCRLFMLVDAPVPSLREAGSPRMLLFGNYLD